MILRHVFLIVHCLPARVFKVNTEKTFQNLSISTRIRLYFPFFRLIWIQTDVRLDPNQSENGKHNLISGWFNQILKRFPYMCAVFKVQYADTVHFSVLPSSHLVRKTNWFYSVNGYRREMHEKSDLNQLTFQLNANINWEYLQRCRLNHLKLFNWTNDSLFAGLFEQTQQCFDVTFVVACVLVM